MQFAKYDKGLVGDIQRFQLGRRAFNRIEEFFAIQSPYHSETSSNLSANLHVIIDEISLIHAGRVIPRERQLTSEGKSYALGSLLWKFYEEGYEISPWQGERLARAEILRDISINLSSQSYIKREKAGEITQSINPVGISTVQAISIHNIVEEVLGFYYQDSIASAQNRESYARVAFALNEIESIAPIPNE